MASREYNYIIVGAGVAGGHAVEGIRELDRNGSILLVGNENHLPYDRPPLTKKLWFGKKKYEEIFIHDKDYYLTNKVDVKLNTEVIEIDPQNHLMLDNSGESYHYKKLLLATGGYPRNLPIPGSSSEGIYYYRYADDYIRLRREALPGKTAMIIGGGFIGAELAAALNINNVDVSMIFPEQYILKRIFPITLADTIQQDYIKRGVRIYNNDLPQTIERIDSKYVITTKSGKILQAEIIIIGIGIQPSVILAKVAGLKFDNGIVVNEYLQTSNRDIYAAGDNAFFPYQALNSMMRVEHWDNAVMQGHQAGRNMAGAIEQFTYMPYFFSDLFDFGFEAVGEVDSRLDIIPCWEIENNKGTLWYLRDGKVRGAMTCNLYNKLDEIRKTIKSGVMIPAKELCTVIS